MRKIGDFEIVDHGIQHSVDCKSENFSHIATGFGINKAKAIYDCIDQMRMVDFDTKGMEIRILEQGDGIYFLLSRVLMYGIIADSKTIA